MERLQLSKNKLHENFVRYVELNPGGKEMPRAILDPNMKLDGARDPSRDRRFDKDEIDTLLL